MSFILSSSDDFGLKAWPKMFIRWTSCLIIVLGFLNSIGTPISSTLVTTMEDGQEFLLWQAANSLRGQWIGESKVLELYHSGGNISASQVAATASTILVLFIEDESRLMYIVGNASIWYPPRQLVSSSGRPLSPVARPLSSHQAFRVWWWQSGVFMAADLSPNVNPTFLTVSYPPPSPVSLYAVAEGTVDSSTTLAWPNPDNSSLQLHRIDGSAASLAVPALPTATLSLLDLLAAGTTVAAWQGNSSGQCATGCVWVAGYRWGRGPVAAVARASNVTGGPDVVPSDAGLAVLWLEAGTTVRQLVLSSSLVVIREEAISLNATLQSFRAAPTTSQQAVVGGLAANTADGSVKFVWITVNVDSPTAQSLSLALATPTLTPTTTRVPTSVPTLIPTTNFPTSASPYLLDSLVSLLPSPVIGVAKDPQLLSLGDTRLLLLWRMALDGQAGILYGQFLDQEGHALLPALTLVLLHWSGSPFAAVALLDINAVAVVYVDTEAGQPYVALKLFNATSGALLSAPFTVSSPSDPFSSTALYSASAAYVRARTLAVAYWTGSALHLKAVLLAGTAGLQVGAQYHATSASPPAVGASFSPMFTLGATLVALTWPSSANSSSTATSIVGACFFVSTTAITQTAPIAVSDAPAVLNSTVAGLVQAPYLLLAWAQSSPDCPQCVFLQRYLAADGSVQGAKQLVGSVPFGAVVRRPAIAALTPDSFVVLWFGETAHGCSLYVRLYSNLQPVASDPALIFSADTCENVAVQNLTAGSLLLALTNGQQAPRGLQLATFHNASALQTPTPAPNLTLLQLTLRTGTVNATVLAWVLLDRGIEASVLDVTVFANGQNAVVRMLPVYSDLDSFLVAACKLKKLADVNNAVVRPIKLASVVVVTTYGQVISIENLCPNVPLPNQPNTTDYTLPVDPYPYAVLVLGTLGGICGFVFAVVIGVFIYTYRHEQRKLEPQMEAAAISPLMLSNSFPQAAFSDKVFAWGPDTPSPAAGYRDPPALTPPHGARGPDLMPGTLQQ